MNKTLVTFLEGIHANKQVAFMDKETVKQSIVMKLLFLLGWDIFNANEVKPNYAVGKKMIDYCLNQNESEKIFIQVISESDSWKSHEQRLAELCLKHKLDFYILTSGIKWNFYLGSSRGISAQNLFWTMDVASDPLNEVAEHLLNFLEAGKVSVGQALKAAEKVLTRNQQQAVKTALPEVWQRLLAEPHEQIVNLLRETTENVCGIRVEPETVVNFLTDRSLRRTAAPVPEHEERDKAPQRLSTGQSISCFSLKNKVYPVKSWDDVVARLCEALNNDYQKDIDKLLWHSVGGKYYFNKNKDELRFSQRIRNTDIYVESQLSPNEIIKTAHSILGVYGFTSSDFLIPLN